MTWERLGNGRSLDVFGVNRKSGDTSREPIRHDDYPMILECDGLTPLLVDTPRTVCHTSRKVNQEGPLPPAAGRQRFESGRRPTCLSISISKVLEVIRTTRGQPRRGSRRFSSTTASVISCFGPSVAALRLCAVRGGVIFPAQRISAIMPSLPFPAEYSSALIVLPFSAESGSSRSHVHNDWQFVLVRCAQTSGSTVNHLSRICRYSNSALYSNSVVLDRGLRIQSDFSGSY